jgi:hypothetical protein
MRSRVVGVAFALLTVAVFAPEPARAGCSGHASSRADVIDDLEIFRGDGASTDPGTRPGDHPGGCTGPACSGRSGIPPAPVSMAIPRSTQWALVDSPPPAEITHASPWSNEEQDARPILPADTIFHPPRPTSPVD